MNFDDTQMNLKKKITLIGSTGLIGSHFLKGIESRDCHIINAITRQKISNLENKTFINQFVEDFSDLSTDFVHDDIVEGSQDTLSLLDRYVEEIETSLDKERIKTKLKSLYIESSDLEA